MVRRREATERNLGTERTNGDEWCDREKKRKETRPFRDIYKNNPELGLEQEPREYD
jgi:hypothetical protein